MTSSEIAKAMGRFALGPKKIGAGAENTSLAIVANHNCARLLTPRGCVVVGSTMLSLMKGASRVGEEPSRGPRDDLAPLATAATSGDAEAVRTFVTAVGGIVLGAVRMVLGPKHRDVDDVTQDALMGLLDALGRFRGECTVSHFAGRVAVLTAMAARRRQQTLEHWVVAADAEGERVAAGPESSPLAQLEARRRRDAIRQLLDELPEPIGEAMALHFMLGHTVDEIASATNVSVNTVWSRLRIGKERLRQKLSSDTKWSEALSKGWEPKR
jgi:RNA polymerase sigma factor (sigma-70 family)